MTDKTIIRQQIKKREKNFHRSLIRTGLLTLVTEQTLMWKSLISWWTLRRCKLPWNKRAFGVNIIKQFWFESRACLDACKFLSMTVVKCLSATCLRPGDSNLLSGARESIILAIHVSSAPALLISSHPSLFLYRQEFIKMSFILIDFRQSCALNEREFSVFFRYLRKQ